jgi:GNAT superfamily N-acetyltransferase
MEITLKLDPDEADVRAVRDGLIAFNRKASGREAGWQPFAIHLTDPASGQPVGGLTGFTTFDWVFVELFHVPEHLRGQGHGRALIERVEAFGRERGCIGIWLDTFSFQARPFYEKLGFSVFGTLEDHPIGGRRYFMQKRLDGATS